MILLPIFITFLFIHVSMQHSVHPRIINGMDATPELFRFIAYLESFPIPIPMIYHPCAGIVINEYWILSSAICVKRVRRLGKGRVKVGKFFTQKDGDDVQIIGIAHTIIHERYSWKLLPNLKKLSSSYYWIFDIALVNLDKAIDRPVIAKLAQPGPYLFGEVYIAGWGKTLSGRPKALQYAILLLMDRSSCQSKIRKAGLSVTILDSQICMHSPTEVITGYTGDSGGPMVHYVNGEAKVIGILSWTTYPEMENEVPSVGTLVSHFRTWIEDKIGVKIPNTNANASMSAPLLLVPQ